jgi:hypothetical protein
VASDCVAQVTSGAVTPLCYTNAGILAPAESPQFAGRSMRVVCAKLIPSTLRRQLLSTNDFHLLFLCAQRT